MRMFTAADYDRCVSDAGDLLELLHGASGRWQTFRGTVRGWHDTELQARAIGRWQAGLGRGGSGSIIFGIGDRESQPREYELTQRLWIAKPDRLREESEHGTTVARGDLWWNLSEHGGLMSNETDRELHGQGAAEAHPLHLSPALLIPALSFETIERLEDRLVVTAKPSGDPHVHFGQPAHGADEHRLTVDASRGVVLEIESLIDGRPFSRSQLLEPVFDEPIPDDVFVLEVPDGVEPRSPRDWHPQVTLEEAAKLAPFAVFAIAELPEGNWRHSVHCHRPPRAEGQAIHVNYHRADGRGFITLAQTSLDNETWARALDQESVQVERDGTRITVSSDAYDEAELRRLAENVVRA
jgi:hypothetical protein